MERVTFKVGIQEVINFTSFYHKGLRGCRFLGLLRLCRSAAAPLSSKNTRRPLNAHRQAVLKKKVSLIYFYTLKHSKLFFLSIGFRSPWRQTQENWWFLLLGPRNNRGIYELGLLVYFQNQRMISSFCFLIFFVCFIVLPSDSSHLLLAG